jgi:hypothetical protein
MIKKALIIPVFLLFHTSLVSEPWKLAKSAEGIQIYTSPVPGTEFSMFRAITRVKTSLLSLVAIWSNADSFTGWMFTCKEARLLEKESEQTYIIYILTAVPWPLSNRDNILRSALTQDKVTGKITIEMTGLPDYMEKRPNTVRVIKAFGKVELTPLENHEIEVSFEYFMNPGGLIPAPIINLFLLDFPFFTLKKMRSVVLEKKFQDMQYSFLDDYR